MKKLFPLMFCIVLCFFRSLGAQEIVFNNPDEAVSFAIQNSQVYIIQRQQVLLNLQEAKFGIQDFLPSFNFSISESDSTILLAGDNRLKSFQATISQEVFDGGRRKFAYDINRLSSMYAYQDYESSLMEFSSQIILLYYQYLMQKQMILIKEDLVSVAKSQLDIIEKEVEIGITLETDYLEYLISYIQIENDRDQSRRDLDKLERRLKISLDINYEATLIIYDNFYHEFTYFYFEPYTDFIWAIIKNTNIEIKKQYLALEYARKQLAYSRRWYVPRLSVQGGISFSGDVFPLTEPKYSLSLTIDFSNASLFPLSLSNSYGLERERLNSVGNSASVRLDPQPTYRIQQNLADITLRETSNQFIQTEKEIQESVIELIISHDNSLRMADAIERTIVVMERRLEFSKLEVEQGEKKHIDYLNELITLSQTRISLIEYQTHAASLERSLEILAGFNFGGLQSVCLQQRL
jgi:outer membrane protein TolC